MRFMWTQITLNWYHNMLINESMNISTGYEKFFCVSTTCSFCFLKNKNHWILRILQLNQTITWILTPWFHQTQLCSVLAASQLRTPPGAFQKNVLPAQFVFYLLRFFVNLVFFNFFIFVFLPWVGWLCSLIVSFLCFDLLFVFVVLFLKKWPDSFPVSDFLSGSICSVQACILCGAEQRAASGPNHDFLPP